MTSQQISFTTSRDGDAFAAYHDLYAPVADVVRFDEDFSASVEAHRLGGMLAFDRKLRSVGHVRSPRRVARNAFDHFTVQMALRGSFRITTGEGEREVPQGAFALVDMTRWMRTDAGDVNLLTLSIPRASLEAVAGDADGLHGAVLPASRAALLGDFIVSFLRHQPELTASDHARVERVTTELLGLALSDRVSELTSAPEAAGEVVCRARAKRFIDAHPGCTPDEVALAIGRSRSVLYRAFQPLGGLAAYIQGRRLVRLRALLVAPGETRQVAELASHCGFASASHCARAFKSRYGLSPGEYRAALGDAGGGATDGDAHQLLARWWGDLR